jgi:hypothetical protein
VHVSGFVSPKGASFIFARFSYDAPFGRNRAGRTDFGVVCGPATLEERVAMETYKENKTSLSSLKT